jgi:hypothetical protein
MLVAGLAVAAATVLVAIIGASQAARHERVLGLFEVPAEFVRTSGRTLIALFIDRAAWVGASVTLLAAALAGAAALKVRRAAIPLFLAAAGLSLVTWGQIELLRDHVGHGIALYAYGLLCAVAWGIRSPLSEREPWAAGAGADAHPPSPPAPATSPRWEALAFLALMILALITRTYALTELPHEYESEMIISMLSTRTLAGLHKYAPWGLVANTNGVAHLLPQWASFQLLGTSVFSLRYVSVVCGLVTAGLFYWLLRRIGNATVARIGTLLFVAAPDQLFWSRQENTPFQFVALLAVISVILSVRLAARPSLRTVLAAAAWMPFTRWFYGPGMVMMLYPIILYTHTLLFRRGTWRTALYAVPILAAGVGLWVFSLSGAYAIFSGGEWRFINPVLSVGAPVWAGEGTFRNATLPELVQLQAANLAKNTAAVATTMTYQCGFSNWFRRADPSRHPTIVNVAIAVLLAVGIGYLLGQPYDWRAFALLVWVGLGMLPAVLSVQPGPRRMVVAFPGFYAVIALTIGALIDQVRACAPRAVASVARAAVGAGVALIAWTSMASYFLLPTIPTFLDPVFRATKPVFDDTDAIYHNLSSDWALLLAFGNSDALFGDHSTPCYQYVRARDWLGVALNLPCSFADAALSFTLPPTTLAALQKSYDPQRISFLLHDELPTANDLTLLRALFPQAPLTELPLGNEVGTRMVWLRTDRRTVDALRTPILHPGRGESRAAELASRVLEGRTLRLAEPTDDDSILVQGTLLIDRNGWYRLGLAPACDAAELSLDGQPVSPQGMIPLTRGAQALALKLPTASACPLPLKPQLWRYVNSELAALPPPVVLAPSVAALPEARALPVTAIAGYHPVRSSFQVKGTPLDFVADPAGALTLLVEDGGAFRILRLDRAGRETASWRLPDGRPLGLSRAPDGTLFVPYENGTVILYGADGTVKSTWTEAPVRTAALGHLPDGSLLSPLPDRNALAVLDRNGKLLRLWTAPEGGPKGFYVPSSVGVDANGDILVIQADGVALLFRTPTDHFAPRFVRSFRIDFFEETLQTRGWDFDQPRGHILVPDPTSANIFTLTLDGGSAMAADPKHDLSQQGLDVVRRVAATSDGIYTLDRAHGLQKFVPLDSG